MSSQKRVKKTLKKESNNKAHPKPLQKKELKKSSGGDPLPDINDVIATGFF